MQSLPLVSIIIPVYNTEKYLRQCLDSVINQIYKNIEIICVNDGSIDGSLKILKEYEDKYSNIKIINLEQNHGVSFARNKALSMIEGEYVCFIDSDDYIDKTFCEKLINKFENNIDLVCGGHGKLNLLGKIISKWYPQINKTNDIIKDIFLLTKHRNVSQKMFKVNIIKKYNITFDESLHYMEDALFLMTYIQFCKKAAAVKEALYIVRINENSLCRNTEYKERRFQEKQIALFKINKLKLIKKEPVIKKTKSKYF